MSTMLEQVCASAGVDVIIDTLELTSTAWPPVRLAQGYFDQQLGLETGEMVTFKGVPLSLVLAKRDNSPNQKITVGVDNVTGEAQRLLDVAEQAEAQVTMVHRRYLASDPSGPSERAFTTTLLDGTMQGRVVQLAGGFMNLLGYKYPRDLYDLNFAPQLTYL